MSNPETKGKLVVVATPIGNLEDISPRALAVLSSASVVFCEDTRRTSNLFSRHGIATPRISCHEHNEYRRRGEILARLEAGETVALVSDAGTPLISDPGERVVASAIGAGLRVEPVPGPSAVTALLSVCGFPCVPFSFLGFPPPRQGERSRFYASFASRAETRVLFESPFRIVESLKAMAAAWNDPFVAVGRELTKLHEEILRGRASALSETLDARTSIKGEFVIAAAPPDFPGFAAAP
ncbi:MAG: 16S rRNA (cytidine(1402)-2'-O)-methyltransferase [Acidobacteria bacterium]|nr:16S rRNA (cytidine(1402)-2'-O)-methyltransferase [Acidobacteriota bacterium]MCG3193961.1 Ribosomal RNA small subunit methyltransferase I [Thermoanaerobaculia bacterium]MCK6682967.1 16S rRNA (cytidine(1402)-2'-O)-methyltransferase [Thermoanaerobaculia bacterium]